MTPQSTYLDGAHHFQIDHQNINSIAGNQYVFYGQREELNLRLNPILDASHTRNRNTSPPDSECFPGTREGVILEITTWADKMDLTCWDGETSTSSDESMNSTCSFHTCDEEIAAGDSDKENSDPTEPYTPHIYWLHGFAGCGKSAISLKVAKIYSGSGRLLSSYFFFRGAGDRSTMRRFAVTLASQLAAALPATAPFIEAAVKAEPGLLTNHVSLATQLDRLVLSPFKSVVNGGTIEETLAKGPFLIVIDGLDECEDKRGVEEFIDYILNFFEEHPSIPLRVFITSRVEQHIRACLETNGVVLGNLDSHSAEDDIEKFLEASFTAVAKKDRIVRAYVRARGSWPTKSDKDKLIEHINGSFVLASTMFKYIVQPPTKDDPTTPMERLPLTLEMNGLDGLYTQTLAHSQHLPHFRNIISTIALLVEPLPIVGISALLGIEAFEVIRVLLNLQAVIHVPGTDEEGNVTVCHTSLRDFLTTESRSGAFFVPPLFHLYLSYYCFASLIERSDKRENREYCWWNFDLHWRLFIDSETCDFIDEIEQSKARQALLVNRVPYDAFLCSMFFCTLLQRQSQALNDRLCMLTECAKQLALAVECPDHRIRQWLKKDLPYSGHSNSQIRFTEHTYEAIRHDLQRASTTLHAKFLQVIKSQLTSSETEEYYVINTFQLSGIDVFMALQWIVARARFKWEEMKITSRPPLELSISYVQGGREAKISFDRVSAINDNDEASTSSESD